MKKHSRALIKVLESELPEVRRGAEIGVWQGGNSVCLLKSFPYLFLYMVDRYKALTPKESKAHARLAVKSQRDFHMAMMQAEDSTKFAEGRRKILVMTSERAASAVKDRYLDFVFIDANHDYESVYQDIRLWAPKVKQGGIISGHDYDGRGDRSGQFGVKKAVDEFFGEDNVTKAGGLVWWVKKRDIDFPLV